MRMVAFAAAVSAWVSAAPAPRSPVSGTWVADLDSQQGLPTDVYDVHDGLYSCESCTPRRRYPADGRLRPVAGSPGHSEGAEILDSRTLSTRIVQPGLVRNTRMRVARDGRTATYVSIDRRAGIPGTLRTEYVARRIAPGRAGSHAVSGSWRGVRYVSVPIELRTTVLSDDGDGLRYRTGTGYSYAARYEGGFVPIEGPYDGSVTVAVRKAGLYRVVETRRRGGDDVQLRTYTVSADGRRLEIATTDLATNTTFRITARKRSARGSRVIPGLTRDP